MKGSTRPRRFERGRARASVHAPSPPDLSVEDLAETRVAGMLAARGASSLLPGLADVEVTRVDVAVEPGPQGWSIEAVVEGYARGPIDARALMAASATGVAVVDALARRGVSAHLSYVGRAPAARAEHARFEPALRASIVVACDAVRAGHKEDRAGQRVRQAVEALGPRGVELVEYQCLGSDGEELAAHVRGLCAEGIDLVLTVGGTGVAHTDETPSAVEPLLDRPVPGLMEAVRAHGQEQTPRAWLSRGVAGLSGDTLILTLPGSSGGAKDACEVLFPHVLHLFRTLRKSRRVLLEGRRA